MCSKRHELLFESLVCVFLTTDYINTLCQNCLQIPPCAKNVCKCHRETPTMKRALSLIWSDYFCTKAWSPGCVTQTALDWCLLCPTVTLSSRKWKRAVIYSNCALLFCIRYLEKIPFSISESIRRDTLVIRQWVFGNWREHAGILPCLKEMELTS